MNNVYLKFVAGGILTSILLFCAGAHASNAKLSCSELGKINPSLAQAEAAAIGALLDVKSDLLKLQLEILDDSKKGDSTRTIDWPAQRISQIKWDLRIVDKNIESRACN